MEARKFRIIGQQQVTALHTLLDNVPKDGSIEVVVRKFKKDCTGEQRALLWIRLAEIAEQAWVAGKQYDSETWHQYLKERFLPEVYTEGITKDKYQKWSEDPSGKRRMIGSTEMLTAKGKSDYITQIEAFATGDLGVMFSADPRRY